MIDRARLEDLVATGHVLSPEECSVLAQTAAALVDPGALDPESPDYELLWRNEHSEGWLNNWRSPRDTGFHDHGGSCVGVYVLAGTARAEGIVLDGSRQIMDLRAGDSYSASRTAIHRMEHDPGAVTIHVYSPPLGSIGHYELIDGELHRHAGPPDEVSPASPALFAALSGP